MEDIMAQLVAFQKAENYDIVKEHLQECKAQNKALRDGIYEIWRIILEEDSKVIIETPALFVGKISDHCKKLLTENKIL